MRQVYFIMRQLVLIGLAVLSYFAVRGLTEGDVGQANRNAEQVLHLERLLSIDFELWLQDGILASDFLVNLANWIYIWGHWPVVISTLVWLAVTRRDQFYELRNAMFISGAIGLVIFALFAVTPPRLFHLDYIDTVTQNSISYRILQPPALVNKYAAVPSLHLGWNLLVGLSWRRASSTRLASIGSVAMPMAMAFAVVATANHWTFDVIAGTAVALAGLAVERARRRYFETRRAATDGLTDSLDPAPVGSLDLRSTPSSGESLDSHSGMSASAAREDGSQPACPEPVSAPRS